MIHVHTTTQVRGEACCERADDEYLSAVWSFTRRDVAATRLTANRTEAGLLRAAVGEWREQCNPYVIIISLQTSSLCFIPFDFLFFRFKPVYLGAQLQNQQLS